MTQEEKKEVIDSLVFNISQLILFSQNSDIPQRMLNDTRDNIKYDLKALFEVE